MTVVTPDVIKGVSISYGSLISLTYRNLSDLIFVHLNDKWKQTGVNVTIASRFI